MLGPFGHTRECVPFVTTLGEHGNTVLTTVVGAAKP